MTLSEIATARLSNQQLISTSFKTPEEIVRWMGAMQAQDYGMSKWAIGIRLPYSTDKEIEAAIDRGEIIRTHVMRPTWHFVSAKDIRWMLELTAPRIHTIVNSSNKRLGLTEAILKKSISIIEKSLEGGRHLTREELMTELGKKKIDASDIRSAHIMYRAELNGLVCNGAMRGKQITYALMDERIPTTKKFDKDEALAELALRYFTSHGPATVQDFCWWSGLAAGDGKKGVELNKSKLSFVNVDTQTFWFSENGLKKKSKTETVHFLPAFDEYMLSYRDRSACIDPAVGRHAMTVNGIFKPIIVVNGKVEGIWKRSLKKENIVVEPFYFEGAKKFKNKLIEDSLKPYANFLNRKVQLI